MTELYKTLVRNKINTSNAEGFQRTSTTKVKLTTKKQCYLLGTRVWGCISTTQLRGKWCRQWDRMIIEPLIKRQRLTHLTCLLVWVIDNSCTV